jgi:hypothetical protein
MSRKTSQASDELGVLPWQLIYLIRSKRINPAPVKNESGDYVWTPNQIEQARVALADIRVRRKRVVPNG